MFDLRRTVVNSFVSGNIVHFLDSLLRLKDCIDSIYDDERTTNLFFSIFSISRTINPYLIKNDA